MADGLLKLCGEPSVPGLALPKAFEALEKSIETVTSLCKMKGSGPQDSQVTGVVLVCKELQRLLRLAFIENGILASRIEMLSYYQDDFIRKCEKKIRRFGVEQKISRKYLKKLRCRQIKFEKKATKMKDEKDWTVDISCSDYDTVFNLSRICGCPDLEFMLRMNQLLLDFVKDPNTNELFLPPMGTEERAELSKLASLYKLRCRFNKSTQVASSVIIKARQTCVPASGELDNLLNSFTKKIKDGNDHIDSETSKTDPEKGESETSSSPKAKESTNTQDTAATTETTPTTTAPKSTCSNSTAPASSSAAPNPSPPITTPATKSIPSYMLTPVSSIGTPIIILEGGDPSLPNSGLTGAMVMKPSVNEGEGRAENQLPQQPRLPLSTQARPDTTSSVATAQSLLKLLPDALESSNTTKVSQVSKSFLNIASKPVQSSPVPAAVPSASSTPTLYSNLYPSSSTNTLPSSSAIQMALLMQTNQQLTRALTAVAAATGGGSTLPVTTTSASSGRSTVLATPLPLSFNPSKSPVSAGVKRSESGDKSTVTGTAVKKQKINRRSQ